MMRLMTKILGRRWWWWSDELGLVSKSLEKPNGLIESDHHLHLHHKPVMMMMIVRVAWAAHINIQTCIHCFWSFCPPPPSSSRSAGAYITARSFVVLIIMITVVLSSVSSHVTLNTRVLCIIRWVMYIHIINSIVGSGQTDLTYLVNRPSDN